VQISRLAATVETGRTLAMNAKSAPKVLATPILSFHINELIFIGTKNSDKLT
jgi:hypothetical protein